RTSRSSAGRRDDRSRRNPTGAAAAGTAGPPEMFGAVRRFCAGCVGRGAYGCCDMRFLHTSDWHLGRSFHREDLLSAQAAFVDHLVETVAAERVDCVLVSGDVYDRALPSVDAVRLCDEALRRLAALTRVVLIAGNHDSVRRLGFGAELMDAAGV